MLGAVGIIAIAAVGGAPAGLRIGDGPGFGPDRPQHRVRTHRASPLLCVVGLQHQAALIRPELIESADDVLEIHRIGNAWVAGNGPTLRRLRR